MDRNIRDSDLIISKAIPAQNTNEDSSALAIGASFPEGVQVEVAVPATPSLANGQTVTVTIQDSANNASFAAIPELATLVITGAGGTGGPATTRKVQLPPSARKFLRMNIAASATAGNNTAVSATMSLLF